MEGTWFIVSQGIIHRCLKENDTHTLCGQPITIEAITRKERLYYQRNIYIRNGEDVQDCPDCKEVPNEFWKLGFSTLGQYQKQRVKDVELLTRWNNK